MIIISLRDKHWLKSCSTKNLNDAAFMHVNATDKQVITRAWCVQCQGETLWRSDKVFFFFFFIFARHATCPRGVLTVSQRAAVKLARRDETNELRA